jgi:hypothetical protein
MKKCLYCQNIATEKHHIIFRSQGGTDHPLNLAHLCSECHYAIHHGVKSGVRLKILAKCYEQIKKNPSVCWTGKIKPKIINILECQS